MSFFIVHHIRFLGKRLMEQLEDLRKKILPILLPWGIKKVAIFGSVARHEETPESDIDILVELKPREERPTLGLKWFGLEEDLSKALGRRVDLVTEEDLSPYIRSYVEKDKIIIYEEG